MRKFYSAFLLFAASLLITGKLYSQISVTATAATTGPTVYTTVKGAFDAINAGTHQGNIVITVTGSTTETATAQLNQSAGASSYTSVLIKPGTGVTAAIQGNNATNGVIYFRGVSNVTIDGSNTAAGTTRDLSIINTSGTIATNHACIRIGTPSAIVGNSNITVENCNISGVTPFSRCYGIISATGVSATLATTAAEAQNTGLNFENNNVSTGGNGIFISGNAGTRDQNVAIANNSVSNVIFGGIACFAQTNLSISGNNIFDINNGTAGITPNVYGVLINGAITGSIFNNNFTNISNYSTSAASGGTYALYLSAFTGSTVNVYNNIIADVKCISTAGTTAGSAYGIYFEQGNGYNVYFNTVDLTSHVGTAPGVPAACGVASTVGANAINLRNNILSHHTPSAGATTQRYAIYSAGSSTSFLAIDNNDYYSTGPNLGFIGVNRVDLAAVQAGFGSNVNSKNIDPSFVSTTNLRLQNVVGNQLLQSGVAIATPVINTDIDGNARAAVPVMGAHEVHIPSVITYTALTPSCGNSNITLSGVNITDAIGIPLAGGNVPRIYFRKNGGAWFSAPGTNTGGTATNSDWSFVISAATVGGLTAGSVVDYYVIAQNNVATVVSNPSAGLSATNVNTVTVAPTTPNSFTVNAIPTVASLAISPSPTCEGTSTTLTSGATSGSGALTSYNWIGPDSYSSTTATPSAIFTPTSTASTGTYSLSVSYAGDGCTSTFRTSALTVNGALPTIGAGAGTVCVGSTTTFTNSTAGGTWSSSNTSFATVTLTTGVVSGVASGTATITYKVGGCETTTIVTVNPIPLPITGVLSVCEGLSTTLANATASGTWVSSNPAVASIAVPTVGNIVGVTAGTSRISYTLATGCSSTSVLTVNPLPNAITGSALVCEGGLTALSCTPAGGTWSSSAPAFGTISTTGVVGGIANGNTTITYTIGTGCIRTREVTVNPSPTPIPETPEVCAGYTATLTSTPAGGTWSSSFVSRVSVDVSTGVITGGTPGVATVSYILPTGCFANASVTCNAAPAVIGGVSSTICVGSTATATNTLAGGTWSSSDIAVATITVGTGFLEGISAGTVEITYTGPSGCFRTRLITVNALPTAIAGGSTTCIGTLLPLSSTPTGGTWSSSTPSVAAVHPTIGLMSGQAAGTSTITYTASNTCRATMEVTVFPNPAAVSGTLSVCPGNTTTLTNSTAGGSWISGNPAIGTVDNVTGVVTGIASGTVEISYVLGTGCYRSAVVTVQPIPAAIVASSFAICEGFTANFSNTTPSGTWSSSNTAVATIGASSGVATAVSGGTTTITYRVSTGCINTTVFTVNPTPSPIGGPNNLCVGSGGVLTNVDGGGTWLSTSPSVATIDVTTGAVNAVGAGLTTISYTLSTGCVRTLSLSVFDIPAPISGSLVVCEGATTNLMSTPGGGTWISSNAAVASVGVTNGIVSGLSAGTTNITYNLGGGVFGCLAIATVTVNPLPLPITGFATICISSTTTLNSLTAGGTWTSGNPLVATVDASGGIVSGIINGTSPISYTLGTGCARVQVVTVNPLPAAITGPDFVCVSSNISLVSSGGGTWSSSDVTKATITTGGVITGFAAGTSNISYILSTGCFRTKQITVNPTPAAISAGTGSYCVGTTVTLTSTPAIGAGTWSSSVPARALVDAATGELSAISIGTSTISYANSDGCRSTTIVTVLAVPANIGGSTIICEASTTTLTNTSAGGIWTSDASGIASIVPGTGFLTGIFTGTANISYTLVNGCSKSVVVTVNPLPDVITAPGTHEVCVGASLALSNTVLGGTWSSSAVARATVNVTTGLVTGVSAGTAVITYRLGTGCFVTDVVTVNALPSGITGPSSTCMGTSTTLTSTTPPGVWASSTPAVATIDAAGNVTPVAAGTTTISYTSTGALCSSIKIFTVNPLPLDISGTLSVCTGSTTTLANATPGGTWSSSNMSVGTVTSTTGVVRGINNGTTTISYTLSTGCFKTSVVTVNVIPATITGTATLCASGNTTTLTSATPGGGTWSSSNPLVATVVAATGVVTSGNNGTATITYMGGSGCFTTRIVTVLPIPSSIVGVSTLCSGSSTNMAASPAGGTWSSSDVAVGTIGGTGLFAGITAGTTTISYVLGNGCNSSKIVTVTPVATLTSLSPTTCIGSSTTLTYDLLGGSYTSSNPTIASVDISTGVVSGVSSGVVNITYTLPTGCRTITSVVVNPLPNAITGVANVCQGFSTTLSSTTGGGTWSSLSPGVATIGSSTGIVVGLAVGTADVVYTSPTTGCTRSVVVTVNQIPAVSGTPNMCVGNSTTLTGLPLGGVWSTSSASTATVGASTGIVNGVSAGTATITYRLSTGCVATRQVTVNVVPTPIIGVSTVCVGATTIYSTTTFGGIWSSSNTSVAIVGTDGVVTGVTAGSAMISYVMGTTCFTTRPVTVLPTPSPIAGGLSVCVGSNTSLSNLTPSGTWSSSNTFIATVGITSGLVSGVSNGNATITYTAPTGCIQTAALTVNPLPSSILGIANVCVGTTSTLSNISTGGTWSTGNPVVATINATTGVVTGVTVGTARITYIIGTGTGCLTTTIVTVTALPANITGVSEVCVGSDANLAVTTPGGTWSSSDLVVASVGTSGVVSGISQGTVIISYTFASGCTRTKLMTVNAVPNPIDGDAEVCLGTTSTLSNTTTGGIWTSSNTSRVTIGVTTGELTGVGVGTSIISYTLPTGCRSYTIATVQPVPSAITGVTNICEGGSTTFVNSLAGGVWTSVFPSVAFIDAATGVATGVSIGIDTIKYTTAGGCEAKITLTVNAAPSAIVGDFDLCLGQTTTLTNPGLGGTWSSSNPSVASIGLSSGIVTSLSAGSTNITYTVGAGCTAIANLVVNPSPSVITGPHVVCVDQTITLFNTVAGGTWSSNNSSIATVVPTTGDVTGVTGGVGSTATITYQLPGGCFATFEVTVNPLPPAIIGDDFICQGLTAMYTNASVASGIWTSSNTAVAPVNLVTGEVTAVSVGNATISFTILGTGCYRTKGVTVNPVPAAITGLMNICVGTTTTLFNTTVGGTWSSSDPVVAPIGSTTGFVTGNSAGTSTMTYTLPTGCFATSLLVVNPLPDAIVGADNICAGSSTTFTNTTAFGTWSSSNTSVATVGSLTGVVTGITNSTATITYTLFATGCYVTKQVTINPLPPTIGGVEFMCLGSTSSVSNPIPGGTWSSSDVAVVSVDGFGNVTANAVGTTTITYTIGTACYVTKMLTVEPTLNPITGPSSVCELASITLANDYVGGEWTSSDVSVATVGIATGIVTGVNDGTVTISYATPLAHCFVTSVVTVDPIPEAITGADTVCVGAITVLASTTPSGTWSSSDVAIATVDAVGIVTGVSANTVLISYTVGSGCTSTLAVRVKALADAGSITGSSEICVGSGATYTTTADAGGTWSSSDIAIATVGTAGDVSGVAVGTAIITYIATNDCSMDTTTFAILVKPLPEAGVLSTAVTGLCINYTTTIVSTLPGGTWSSSNSAIASVNAAGVVTGLSSGTATISYSMTSDCGVDVATIDITVFSQAPFTAIITHPDTVLCANTLFRNFGAAAAPGTGVTYTWTADNAEVYATSAGNRQNALISFHNPGTAVVRLTTQITATGCFITDSFVATINNDSAYSPEIKYYADELICTDNTSGSYQWGYDDAETLDSTLIFGAIYQSYYLPVPDFTNKRYWVIAERGGCYQKVYYTIPTDVKATDINGIDVRLFPNPATATINIEVKGLRSSDNISVRMVDMLGRELNTSNLVNGKGSINVADLASGVYSVMFLNNGVKVTSKTFVKN